MRRFLILFISLVLSAWPDSALAKEVFAGLYSHGVRTPFSIDIEEGSTDLQLGYRFASLENLGVVGRPAPYILASVNSLNDTSFVGVGIGWKLDVGRVYLRPEVGFIVHDGPSRKTGVTGRQLQLGSRVLFQPGMSVGIMLDRRVSLEASWVHVSHGGLFNSQQNPGLDMLGVRANLKL